MVTFSSWKGYSLPKAVLTLCQAPGSAPASSPFILLEFQEARPLVSLVMALRVTACWGVARTPPRLPSDHHHASQLLFGGERTSADEKKFSKNEKGHQTLV